MCTSSLHRPPFCNPVAISYPYLCRRICKSLMMKTLSLLLSIFVVLLSVVPCNWDVAPALSDSQLCYHDHTTDCARHSHPACPAGHCCCSPFSGCSCCANFVNVRSVVWSALATDTQQVVYIPYDNNYSHLVFACIWQPPKIC